MLKMEHFMSLTGGKGDKEVAVTPGPQAVGGGGTEQLL